MVLSREQGIPEQRYPPGGAPIGQLIDQQIYYWYGTFDVMWLRENRRKECKLIAWVHPQHCSTLQRCVLLSTGIEIELSNNKSSTVGDAQLGLWLIASYNSHHCGCGGNANLCPRGLLRPHWDQFFHRYVNIEVGTIDQAVPHHCTQTTPKHPYTLALLELEWAWKMPDCSSVPKNTATRASVPGLPIQMDMPMSTNYAFKKYI